MQLLLLYINEMIFVIIGLTRSLFIRYIILCVSSYNIPMYADYCLPWSEFILTILLQAWQCGGSIAVIPCSRVGHIFRYSRPYSNPNGTDTASYNTVRTALVWLDNYTVTVLVFLYSDKDVSVGKYVRQINALGKILEVWMNIRFTIRPYPQSIGSKWQKKKVW